MPATPHRSPHYLAFVLPLALAACVAAPAARPDSQQLALTGVHVVDVAAGTLQRDQTVVIEGDHILAVQPAMTPLPAGTRRVAGEGAFVIPGLWDMHVHVTDAGYLPQFVAHGVTGVRDMGGGLDAPADGCESINAGTLRQWRREIVALHRTGPELVISGPAVSGSGWPSSLPARTVDEAETSVRALAAQGVDFIKVYAKIPLPAFRALAREAARHRLHFAGHVPEDVGPLQALRLGQRSIEHLRDALLVCFTEDRAQLQRFFAQDGWGADDQRWGWTAHAACADTIDAFRAGHAWLTPTLVVEHAKVAVEEAAYRDDVRRRALPPSVQAGFQSYANGKLAQPASERASERLWWDTQQRLVGRLHDAGVPMLAGTDSACQGGLPGASLHDELQALVAAGLSPAQALRAATLEPARYLARNNQGEVAAGQRTDLVLLEADPLTDIANTRRIRAVVIDGRLLDRAALDDLAAEGAKQGDGVHGPAL